MIMEKLRDFSSSAQAIKHETVRVKSPEKVRKIFDTTKKSEV